MIAIGGDVRLAASQILGHEGGDHVREVSREAFLSFCDEVERLDDDGLVSQFRLPAVEAETLLPALFIYRALLIETTVRRVVVSDASLRAGLLLEILEPVDRVESGDFSRQVLASAEALGQRYRFDKVHGRHVSWLATRLFDELREEHGLSTRDRLLLETAGLLHDIGIYVSPRAHHKHSQYLLGASQIFGLSDEETAIVSNIARYHRRGLPQRSHLPYRELDSRDRLRVSKLAAMLRVTNALDAEHLQKVRNLHLRRDDNSWLLELECTGDITMEQMAAAARADMFIEVFGRHLVTQPGGIVG
jgi:exopolyphosphatase/guanosine-5'-triphosphate,3'-diphosphate pyrophosphatase